MGEETVLTRASVKGRSLRTTVPSGIVKLFDLRQGDRLRWEIKVYDGELLIVVKPIRREDGNEK